MRYLVFVTTLILALASCRSRVQRDNGDEEEKYNMYNKNLITANKYLIKEDAERTASYIKRRGWKTEDGDGGLKYIVFERGNGDSINASPKISMSYKLELLDGTVCYTSDEDGPKELVVGSSEMETGLVKLFKKMCHGDSAALILPPYFAKGLIGDLDKIPPHSVLVYYIRIN